MSQLSGAPRRRESRYAIEDLVAEIILDSANADQNNSKKPVIRQSWSIYHAEVRGFHWIV